MDPVELTSGLALAALVAGVAGFYALRQRHTLRQLRDDAMMPVADRAFYHAQVRRRLAGCALMVVFAGFLVGWFFVDDLNRYRLPEGAPAPAKMPDEAKEGLRFAASYLVVALTVLLAFVGLAILDLWATVRFGWRKQKQLESDRRAMLEQEAARLRYRPHELN